MCGIAGVIARGSIDVALLRRMNEVLAHRGPDDQGIWVDERSDVGFAHRRLAIVDLSPSGHQPMASRDGRFMLVYNGEIYNQADLRAELETGGAMDGGIEWRGHSDTEVLVEAIATWGLEATLRRCVGMFALAVWDQAERRLHLVRDRFGEKPLYYGRVGEDFVFASELKAIRVHPEFANSINRRALRLFASRTYIPAPLTIFDGIYKLLPGTILTLEAAAATGFNEPPSEGASGPIQLRRYWSYADVIERGLADPIEDEDQAIAALDAALADAVQGQAVADVPVGAFLSGGIDSSTIVAFYQQYSLRSIRTFSIGFEEAGFDEAQYARSVADYLGTDHHERYVTFADAQAVIPLLPTVYDEPFADPSQIPTYLVSKFAREQVTVALSGDGGDELFGGYNRHSQVPRLWSKVRRVPVPIRAMASGAAGAISPAFWNRLSTLQGVRRQPSFGTKVQKGIRAVGGARGVVDIYESFLDEWNGASPIIDYESMPANDSLDLAIDAPDVVQMMYGDSISYLPDDILCKVDRAAMAVSLETRVPFLDHRVAEVAARIPVELKFQAGRGKHILRQLLYSKAPRSLFERPKAGFAIPVGEWIRAPLREWAEELLDPRRLRDDGCFDPIIVRRRWENHLAGREDATHALWAILMFQGWRTSLGAGR